MVKTYSKSHIRISSFLKFWIIFSSCHLVSGAGANLKEMGSVCPSVRACVWGVANERDNL